jgi:hypothetical protein
VAAGGAGGVVLRQATGKSVVNAANAAAAAGVAVAGAPVVAGEGREGGETGTASR